MRIINAIIHKLEKEPRSTDAEYRKGHPIQTNSGALTRFAEALQTAYSKKSKATGSFNDNENVYRFPIHLKEYFVRMEMQEPAFVQFTENAMELLVNKVKTEPMAKGGFVLFLHYSYNDTHYLMVLLLSHKNVFNIEDLDIEQLKAVDLETLRYAARIDLTKWSNTLLSDEVANEENNIQTYLNFIRGSAESVSRYFQDFIGCTDFSPAQQSTKGMIDASRKYMADVMDLSPDERRNVEQAILEYCLAQRENDNPASQIAIAGIIDHDNVDRYITYMGEQDDVLYPDSFVPHLNELRKLKRYSYKSNQYGWNLTFDHVAYEEYVNYDPEEDRIVITNVPKDFADKLDL